MSLHSFFLYELPQPLAPGLLVRRADQYAVNVEDSAPENPSPLPPFLLFRKRASALAGQAVALLLYLLYELVVGVDELLHTLLLQHLHYLLVVHPGFP
jgi:hypothetical protein